MMKRETNWPPIAAGVLAVIAGLLLIALLITTNLVVYRYLRSGSGFDAVFGALINGAFWYGVLLALRWLWRRVYRLFRKGVPIEER